MNWREPCPLLAALAGGRMAHWDARSYGG